MGRGGGCLLCGWGVGGWVISAGATTCELIGNGINSTNQKPPKPGRSSYDASNRYDVVVNDVARACHELPQDGVESLRFAQQ